MPALVNLDPAEVELRFARGDDAIFNVRAESSDSPGTYIDFSTYSNFLCQLRVDPDATTVLATATVVDYDNGGGDRGVTVSLAAADTADLPETCCWDLQMDDADGKTRTWFAGPVRVKRDTSR